MPDKSKFKFSLWPWKSTKQENHPDSNAIDEPQQQQTENTKIKVIKPTSEELIKHNAKMKEIEQQSE